MWCGGNGTYRAVVGCSLQPFRSICDPDFMYAALMISEVVQDVASACTKSALVQQTGFRRGRLVQREHDEHFLALGVGPELLQVVHEFSRPFGSDEPIGQ